MDGAQADHRCATAGASARRQRVGGYGIPSAGIALTAGSDNDHIGVLGHGATSVTAQTIFGGAGNDIINFGSIGTNATLVATVSGKLTDVSGATLSSTFTDSDGVATTQSVLTAANFSGGTVGTVSGGASIVITAAAAISTIDSAFVRTDAGNDTIALGSSLTRVTATQLKAGAGNDFIGFGTQINVQGSFSTASQDSVAFRNSTIVGGSGNDTIKLDGDNTFTAFNISAGAGNDNVNLVSAHVLSSRIGLGAGNDIVSGFFGELDQVSIQGGSGNDTIYVNAIASSTIGGDALNAAVGVADGNDSIILGGVISAVKIYGGGGNDIVQISAADVKDSGNLINLGAGRDTINLSADSVLLKSAQIRMGGDNDLITFADDGGSYVSSFIKMGGGNDTVKFTTGINNADNAFASTTIFGNAGSDLLFDSATVATDQRMDVTFGYNTADSTIAGYDTIAVGGGAITGVSYHVNVSQGSLQQLQLATANYTASNSMVTFTSTFSQDLTARVEQLDATTSKGEVALFQEGNSSLGYLFVQGGTVGTSDDTVVQIGTASINSFANGHLTISGTNNSFVDFTLG
jgi:hypothetical protein